MQADKPSLAHEHARALSGGSSKYHAKNKERSKLFARERLNRLVDPGTWNEDGLLANCADGTLPADGVVTGTAKVEGRLVAFIANDSTVKAGSWGKRTVEKMVRIQEVAEQHQCPLVYLIDSAGARITDQIEMFPGRRGAGRIFHNQIRLSGQVPQLCLLFGPSAAGGAYVPAFCDVVVMVEGNASMYLGSPRMAEMVIGERVTLEEMGGAQMHCSTSGCGDVLVQSEEEGLDFARRYLRYMPTSCAELPLLVNPASAALDGQAIGDVVPSDENKPFDMMQVVNALVDADSWLELKAGYATEMLTGLARIEGRVVGVVANQPKCRGGILFVESANKAARFVSLCDAFNIPLIFLADVPGFMIGTRVERQGIIRAGAKMVSAVSAATVPKFCVVVRKAYGAGLYAMCGPAFEPDATLALPTASIAVMGAQAAVNAVYYNKLQEVPEGPERDAVVKELREEYQESIDILKLASELVVDAVVEGQHLRVELGRRLDHAAHRIQTPTTRKHVILPM